jgi:pantothenate kinase
MPERAPNLLHLTPADALAAMTDRATALLARPGRQLLGIAGGPGAGKSTLAQLLVATLGPVAAHVPMDGFHMRQAKLAALGTAADKGMPHTFEGAAFVAFLAELKAAQDPVQGPAYSRRTEDVVVDAYTVAPAVRLLAIEGNYLLLDTPPWDAVRPLVDLAVFLDLPWTVAQARLRARHAEAGRFTEAHIRDHIARVDRPNHDLVAGTAARADLRIALVTGS